MWQKSKPNDYTSFRTFIFGITSQSMFPHGVVYEGVSEEPMSFRGESGANDSMVRCSSFLPSFLPSTSKSSSRPCTRVKLTHPIDSLNGQPSANPNALYTTNQHPQRFPRLPTRKPPLIPRARLLALAIHRFTGVCASGTNE